MSRPHFHERCESRGAALANQVSQDFVCPQAFNVWYYLNHPGHNHSRRQTTHGKTRRRVSLPSIFISPVLRAQDGSSRDVHPCNGLVHYRICQYIPSHNDSRSPQQLLIATSHSISQIAIGEVCYALGFSGLQILQQIVIADMTTLRYRLAVSPSKSVGVLTVRVGVC